MSDNSNRNNMRHAAVNILSCISKEYTGHLVLVCKEDAMVQRFKHEQTPQSPYRGLPYY